jgi:hypothetical protein
MEKLVLPEDVRGGIGPPPGVDERAGRVEEASGHDE